MAHKVLLSWSAAAVACRMDVARTRLVAARGAGGRARPAAWTDRVADDGGLVAVAALAAQLAGVLRGAGLGRQHEGGADVRICNEGKLEERGACFCGPHALATSPSPHMLIHPSLASGPTSMYFLALSQAPPVLDMDTASCTDDTWRERMSGRSESARGIQVSRPTSAQGRTIKLCYSVTCNAIMKHAPASPPARPPGTACRTARPRRWE
jgi:hypothetical protein